QVGKSALVMAVAGRKLRPEFRAASGAWKGPESRQKPKEDPGPTYMPEYKQPDQEKADELNAEADRLYAEGATAGTHADQYVRVTVYLATVLFLIAISGHFRLRGVRIGLVVVGTVVLVIALGTLATLPRPPA